MDDAAATTAVCQTTAADYRRLTEVAGQGTGVESLRDAIPVLQDRLREIGDAAEGRPQLGEVLTLGRSVLAAWQEAIAAADAGDNAASQRAVRRADGLIGQGDDAVAAGGVDPADCS